MEKRKSSCTVAETVNSYSPYENSMDSPQKTRNKTTIWPINPTTGHAFWEKHNSKRYMHPVFTEALFIIARIWKHPRCPLTDEWIKKLWYIILLHHKKAWIWVSCNKVDEPRAYHTERRKSEREKQIQYIKAYIFVVVQSLSHIQLFAPPWIAAHQTSLSFTISWSLLKFMFIELLMPSNHLVLCCPLLLLPSIFLSIRVFFPMSCLFASDSPSIGASASVLLNEYSRLISFRIDWFELLVAQGIFKSLLQEHSSKVSILWQSVFFMVQVRCPYMTTGKTTDLFAKWYICFLTHCLGLS